MDKICAALPRKWHMLAYNFSSFRLHSSQLGQKYLAWISIRKIRTNWWIELTRSMWISDGFATTVHISKVHFHIACTHTEWGVALMETFYHYFYFLSLHMSIVHTVDKVHKHTSSSSSLSHSTTYIIIFILKTSYYRD